MLQSKTKFSIYNDEELMQHIVNGEVVAFDELYYRYSKSIMAYLYRMLNFDKALAEDALQDIFLKIAEAPQKFDRSRSFKTWIFSVASNSCKNYYRHKNIVNESKSELLYYEESKLDNSFMQPLSKLDALKFNNLLSEVLNELPAEKKEAFILRYQEDRSLNDIAEIQNCPLGSVKSRLHYTIKQLEEKLQIFNPTL
jgi:RNA polymerase sigma-70 factor, ECF subfamily